MMSLTSGDAQLQKEQPTNQGVTNQDRINSGALRRFVYAMPALPYYQIAALLLLHSWKSEGSTPIYAYDDPDVNAKLGIKRVSGTTARNDHPVGVPEKDRESFSNFISICMNATLEQLKQEKRILSFTGQKAWQSYCSNVICRGFNTEIDHQMTEAGIHPQQLLEMKGDVWDQSRFSYNAQSIVGRIVAQTIFGEILVEEPTGLVHPDAGSYLDTVITYNIDRLRKLHGRTQKKLGGFQSDLDKAMKSKRSLIS